MVEFVGRKEWTEEIMGYQVSQMGGRQIGWYVLHVCLKSRKQDQPFGTECRGDYQKSVDASPPEAEDAKGAIDARCCRYWNGTIGWEVSVRDIASCCILP